MIFELIVGFVLGLLIFWIVIVLWDTWTRPKSIVIDDPTDDDPEFDKLQHTVHCPYCASYDVKLVDDNSGVPWLKGKVSELDHYQCQRCYETFQDENWDSVKVYNDKIGVDD